VQPIQIDLVILNLCKNAIEAMNEVQRERVLTVVAQTGKDGTVAVAVQDTGPGVRQELRDALFDPFVTSKTQGMGLGLSISQGIVSAHQGRLFCEDAPGGGAVFRFVLPINGSGSNG
jgi:two-component system sensor kinase FixL